MEEADGKVELLEEWLEDLDAKKERKQFEERQYERIWNAKNG